jgi:2-polyprenyl-3-methyl-5-hydroxy-6-metoxy-1,4-benzoquinol methylase
MKRLSACPVCGSERIRHDLDAPTTRGIDGKVWQIDRCEDCTHGFMNPQPTWDELEAYYTASYDPYDPSHGAEAPDHVVVEKARRDGEFRHVRISHGIRLLDVGCGAGFFLRIAARLGAEVQGVEPSDIAASRARETGIPVFTGTVEDYVRSSEDRQFDLITANHVLEHTPDAVRTLEVMKGLLAPGSVIWIGVPNADCTFSRRLRTCWYSLDVPFHLMQFTMASLSRAAELAGLKVLSVRTYSLPASTAASLRELLRRRYLIPKRITQRIGLIDTVVAPWLARRHDRQLRGEAIVAEFGR